MSRSFGATELTSRAVDADLALADGLEPGDHGEQGRLAAAGGADERDEFAGPRLEIDALEHLDRAEALAQAPDGQRRHVEPSLSNFI